MPAVTLNIGMQCQISGELVFTGTNDIGPQVVITLPLVQFGPIGRARLHPGRMGPDRADGRRARRPDDRLFGTLVHPDDAMVSPTTDAYYVGTGHHHLEGRGRRHRAGCRQCQRLRT